MAPTTWEDTDFVMSEAPPNEIFNDSSQVASTENSSSPCIKWSIATAMRFNFLVVGPSGSGKTTFAIRLLRRYFPDFHMKSPEGCSTKKIGECGRAVKVDGDTTTIVTVVDTVGFFDSINNNDSFDPIIQYIENQNSKYEQDEGFRRRWNHEGDTRVHACFYFFAPHRITPLDCEFMKRLQSKVSIIPIIAKADSLSTFELAKQLSEIHSALNEHNISVFDFEEKGIDETWLDEPLDKESFAPTTATTTKEEGSTETTDNPSSSTTNNVSAPRNRPMLCNVFAVISGSRHYPWISIGEDDQHYSDTVRLHNELFERGILGKLLKTTDEIHERWRSVQNAGILSRFWG